MYERQIKRKVEQKKTTQIKQEGELVGPGRVTRNRMERPNPLLMQARQETERQVRQETERKVEVGLKAFFGTLVNVSTKALASGILGAALLPFFGPVGVIGISLGAAVALIQDELRPLDPDLQDDTIRKLVEPLQGKQLDERELRRVIEEVLSQDRQANEDLAKAFFKLQPAIQEVARSTEVPNSPNINISGPVYGLVVGDENTVTQTFRGFLSKDTYPRRPSPHNGSSALTS